ncbi:GTP-binding protein EngC [Actinotalea ferrariae CF5-4]|uniref:Small ribosomal subunit biogenesis GTPase RsgA n=1 Tax=Actinotalea ferrariae CF5-4 TaxID=948458 RepID=A0A021VUS8_9CELL|nr:ribosome small subunit-dependent GTPase A [Actinotalea ferrariae]EYR64944.1 GTP-binding protein EngC [Actinotalea ferrariae CF5-4]
MSLPALGWDDDWAAQVDVGAGRARSAVARVSRADATSARLLTPDGEASVAAHGLVVGDWVVLDGTSRPRPLARRTLLSRQSSGRDSTEQPLAANVDVVAVVEPMWPEPNVRRIERMLTLAWASGGQPLVILSKADLFTSGVRSAVAEVESAAPGVDVLAVSATCGDGLAGMRHRLGPGRTFVLLGPSGAGKSSLVNALAGEEVLATGDVRGDGRGRHTTTHRELVLLEGVGLLIDTPGIRSVGMTADDDGLARVFEDVVVHAADCRYTDCGHAVEPGCSVRAAVDAGALPAARVESYLRLQREIEHQSRRKRTRERSQERRDTTGRNQAKAMAMRAKGR